MSKSPSQSNTTLEVIGWIGMLMILGAFALNSFNIVEAQSYLYQSLNLIGALGIMAISVHKKVYQSVALNVVWVLIALIAIVNIMRIGE